MELKNDDSSDEFFVVDDGTVATPTKPILIRAPSAVRIAPKPISRGFVSPQAFRQQLLRGAAPLEVIEEEPPIHPANSLVALPSSTGLSIANAFGQPPPLPVPLTVTGAVTAPTLKTNAIYSSAGELKMSLGTTGQIGFSANGLNTVGIIQSAGIYFQAPGGDRFTLTKYEVFAGSYALPAYAGAAFGAGSGSYLLTQIGRQYMLQIDNFTGTTAVLGAPYNSQRIVFTPSLATYLPAGTDDQFPCRIITATSTQGVSTISTNATPGELTIYDSDAVAGWQWASATAGQGWPVQTICWSN